MYPNKIRISNGEGQVSITAISRAFEVGQVAEDFDLSKYTSVEHGGTAEDTDQLSLGCALVTTTGRPLEFLNCAIYYFALYNKSLTPEEIETEKERLNEEWLKRKTE